MFGARGVMLPSFLAGLFVHRVLQQCGYNHWSPVAVDIIEYFTDILTEVYFFCNLENNLRNFLVGEILKIFNITAEFFQGGQVVTLLRFKF